MSRGVEGAVSSDRLVDVGGLVAASRTGDSTPSMAPGALKRETNTGSARVRGEMGFVHIHALS